MSSSTHSREETYGGTGHLTESAYHKLLESDLRRAVLAVLSRSSAPLDLGELAERVREHQSDGDCVDAAARKRTRLHLHHTHLPKMDALGVLDYDSETKRLDRW